MNKRLEANKNEILISGDCYRGLHVNGVKGYLIQRYLEQMFLLIENALNDWGDIFALRFDLHFPAGSKEWHSKVVSDFIDSFNSKWHWCLKRWGVEPAGLRPKYAWGKETVTSVNPHYHFLLILDGNTVWNAMLDVNNKDWRLRDVIESSWQSALDSNSEKGAYSVDGLVEFPPLWQCVADISEENFLQQINNLFYRASYIAKVWSKHWGTNNFAFRRSQLTPLKPYFDLQEIISYHKVHNYRMNVDDILYSTQAKYLNE